MILLLTLLSGRAAQAATYYFANGGNDGNPCTSQGSPCATIARAGGITPNAGDSFLFNRGDTFVDSSGNGFDWTSRSGTSGSHITIGAYGSGARPIISKSGTGYGLILKSSDWIDVSSLHIVGYDFGIELRGVQNATFTDIHIASTGAHCFKTQHDTANANRPTRNVTLTLSEMDTCGSSGNGEGFYLGSNDAGDTTSNITVTNNYFHNTFFECLEVKQGTDAPITILNNTFEHCHRTNHPTASPPGGDSGTGIVAVGTSGNSSVVFYKNWIKDVVGNENDHSGVGARWDGQGMDARFNVIANNEGEGLVLKGSTGFQQTWANNTLYGNGRECTNVSGTTKTLTDNICWANASGNDGSDPAFVAAASNNFNIPSTSPAYLTGASGSSKGALQSWAWTAGEVLADGKTVRLTGAVYTSIVTSFQPISSATASAFTITCSVAGIQTGATATPFSVTQLDVTVPSTIVQGETCTVSATAGAAQDSANIGGMLAPGGPRNSTSLAVVNLALTNNSAGGETAPNLLTAANLLTDCATCTIGNCTTLVDGVLTANGGTDAESSTSFTCEHDLGTAKALDLYRAYCDDSGNHFTTNVSVAGKLALGDSYTTFITQGVCNHREWFEFVVNETYRYIRVTFECIGCVGTQAFEHYLRESPSTLPPPGARKTKRLSVRTGRMR